MMKNHLAKATQYFFLIFGLVIASSLSAEAQEQLQFPDFPKSPESSRGAFNIRSLPTSISGNVVYVETEGYYPALTFSGKAAEATFKSLSVAPYQSDDGTIVKAGQNLICARSTRIEGLDEILVYQCFQSVHSNGSTYPGYLPKTPENGNGNGQNPLPTPGR